MQVLFIITKSFFAICLLRKGPQDLPQVPEFLFVCILAHLVSSTLLGLSVRIFIMAVAASLFEILLLLLFSYALLSLRSLAERWTQTCTALAGTATLFNLMAMPLFNWFSSLGQDTQSEQVFYLLLFVGLLVWSISVMAHIFRHALSVSFPAGIIISILLVWCMAAMNSMIFPHEALQ